MFKFTVLFFLALALSACTSTTAQPIAVQSPETAYNVTETASRIEAQFPDACFVIYTDGNGATACFGGRQWEIETANVQSQGCEWTAVNPCTFDYIVLNTQTGVVSMKIASAFDIFLPNVEGTADVSKM